MKVQGQVSHFRDRGAPDAEHLGKEFLRKLDGVTLGTFRSLKEPSAEPWLDLMQSIAGGSDPRLIKQRFVVAQAEIGDGLA